MPIVSAGCEVCFTAGPAEFDDDMNIVCKKCLAANLKPTHTCPVCLDSKVPERDDVCAICKMRSGL